ncbi:hypothetical protein JEQ12_009329 [Ovis aries]|uniref:Uncharacterized protein n=1 Tax=Ovis aries TaxID=9940 RepID=A0A836AMI7_SHEEP|nr:hypothetical protein JEQ12_009329 [Ovis aries]
MYLSEILTVMNKFFRSPGPLSLILILRGAKHVGKDVKKELQAKMTTTSDSPSKGPSGDSSSGNFLKVTVRESHRYSITTEKYFPHSALTPDGFYQSHAQKVKWCGDRCGYVDINWNYQNVTSQLVDIRKFTIKQSSYI